MNAHVCSTCVWFRGCIGGGHESADIYEKARGESLLKTDSCSAGIGFTLCVHVQSAAEYCVVPRFLGEF